MNWLILVVCAPWILWVFFVAVMRLKQVRDADKLTTAMKVFGYPALAIGLVFDLLVNLTVAALIFLEPPRELTVSARLTRLSTGPAGWRQRWAEGIRKALLDEIDPAGIHHG